MVSNNSFRYLFIVNPKAGKGRFKKLIPHIKKELPTHIPYDIVISQFPGEAKRIIRKNFSEYDVFVAAGGDGTVNEVSSELINTDKHLGIIAIGSGNGLARALSIPINYSKALNTLLRANPKIIDSIRINNRTFINMAGVGFDATIAQRFEGFGKRGIEPYAKLTFKTIFSYKPRDYNISIDNKQIARTAYMLSIANTSQFGGGAHICPPAKPNDGIIHLTILNPFRYTNIPIMAYNLFTKRIEQSKAVEIFAGKEILIKGEKLCTHIDGEPVELGDELEIHIIPKSISILC
jgi:diacylglycerol kinase (ATP)